MSRTPLSLLLVPVLLSAPAALAAPVAPVAPVAPAVQEPAAPAPAGVRTLVVSPAELTLEVGESRELEVTLTGPDGAALEADLMFFSRSRRSVACTRAGVVTALKPGTFEVVARERRQRSSGGEGQASREELGERLSATVTVTVRPPALAVVELEAPGALYVGTAVELGLRAIDVNGAAREKPAVEWASSAPDVASFDASGELVVHAPGTFTATATVEGLSAAVTLAARPNPVASLALTPSVDAPRTGDVVRIGIDALDAAGTAVLGVPVEVGLRARPDDTLGNAAPGQLAPVPGATREWRFVAEQPGLYTFIATTGNVAARLNVRVTAREVGGRFEFVGHAPVRDTHTSDLWVWEGLDGRDYCVTGTWGANGDAHFWDVTDPSKMERVATISVDARTINDVKVSADGKLCVLSREGASSRKNGIVLVDVSDPRNPRIVSGFDDNLTGGVHNVFVDGNEVYALSAGTRYDAINVSDPGAPARVGSYQVDRQGSSIHDVWVEDGLAYSSNWSDGVHIVDVGNGVAGGSPENPVKVSSYAYPSGWNHAAFPFRQADTGRFYVAAGDEAFPFGLNLKDKPTRPRGWIHFIDFTDLDAPAEVARYEVPEAGTHNLWIEDGVMYVAYYNAGLRAVDITGELMGDLYRQGREIAFFLPDDPEGYVANAPMAWGPQPYKGHVFFSDWNSGLWAVKLVR